MRIGDRVAVYGVIFEEEVSDKGVRAMRLTGRVTRIIGDVVVITRDVNNLEMYVHERQCELLGLKRWAQKWRRR